MVNLRYPAQNIYCSGDDVNIHMYVYMHIHACIWKQTKHKLTNVNSLINYVITIHIYIYIFIYLYTQNVFKYSSTYTSLGTLAMPSMKSGTWLGGHTCSAHQLISPTVRTFRMLPLWQFNIAKKYGHGNVIANASTDGSCSMVMSYFWNGNCSFGACMSMS